MHTYHMPCLLSGKGEQEGPALPKKKTFLPRRSYKPYWRKRKQACYNLRQSLWQCPFSVYVSRTSQPSHKTRFCCLRTLPPTIPTVQPSRRQVHLGKKINRVTKDNQSSHGENLLLISLVLLWLEVTLKWYRIKVFWLTQSKWQGYREKAQECFSAGGASWARGLQTTRHEATGRHPLLGARDSRRQSLRRCPCFLVIATTTNCHQFSSFHHLKVQWLTLVRRPTWVSGAEKQAIGWTLFLFTCSKKESA